MVGARVAFKLISTVDRPREMFSGETDDDGRIEAALEVPLLPGGNAAVLCQAESGEGNAEVHHLVRKRGPSATV